MTVALKLQHFTPCPNTNQTVIYSLHLTEFPAMKFENKVDHNPHSASARISDSSTFSEYRIASGDKLCTALTTRNIAFFEI